MNKNIVYSDGKYIPLDEARISVLDRGFLFADGVYEVIPIYNGKPFCKQQHLDRLQKSLQGIYMQLPFNQQQWYGIFDNLIKENNATQGNYHIYLQVTRGVASSRGHAFPDDIKPTVFIAVNKSTKVLPYQELCRGKAAITAQDIRWSCCHIKSISLLPNILLSQQAKRAGCEEAILIRDGYAIEGASSNLFIVKNNNLITPPLSSYILGGITREIVIELARKNEILCKEQQITESELANADEIWITSSTREIYPITRLDDRPVGDGKVGSIWEKMIKLYRDNTCNK
jgi:D-alanine transaminase